ncbi:MAG: hypothetical protein LC777_06800 [Actinobacteria bacterium]|nr:hypothetical protein [Actinomycetota bacterium]
MAAAAACLLAPLTTLADILEPLRIGATLVLFCLAPGAAALPLLAPRSARIEPALILGSSLALLTAVALAMLCLRAWAPATATYIVAAACLLAIVIQLRPRR